MRKRSTSLSCSIVFLIAVLAATSLWPPAGAIALAAAFILFPRYLKEPIERWLFKDADHSS